MQMPKSWIAAAAVCLVVGGVGGAALTYGLSNRNQVPSAEASAPVLPAPSATTVPSQSLEPAGGDIGAEGAKAFALAHAGVAAQQAAGVKVEQEWENGRLEYEVEFWDGTVEYDYTIDGATGSVLEYKKEDRLPAAGGNGYIGEEAAGQAALAHAGIGTAAAQGYSCVVHHSDGVPHCYQVQFDCGDSHYEYEIGLYDGAVLHHGCSTYGHHRSSHHMGGHH